MLDIKVRVSLNKLDSDSDVVIAGFMFTDVSINEYRLIYIYIQDIYFIIITISINIKFVLYMYIGINILLTVVHFIYIQYVV